MHCSKMGVKQRLKDHFYWSSDYVALRHENSSDFYLSCWQSSRSPYPLLFARIIIFLGALGTLIASLVFAENVGNIGYWATYNTQWAVALNTACTGIATAISVVACWRGPIDSTFGIPWYIRLYWALYCITLPLSFFVTFFYYSFLTDAYPEDFNPNPVVDLLVHGINSVVMFCLMAVSRHSIVFFQFIYPLLYFTVYVLFTVIYFAAGGTSAFGEPWIYPMLDWSNPGSTIGIVLAGMVVLTGLTVVSVFFSMLRDWLSRKWNSTSNYAL